MGSNYKEFNNLTTEELKDLCNSSTDEKFDDIVNQSDEVRNLTSERELLMVSVKSLAEFNLAQQNNYESDRNKLLALVGDCNKLKEEIQSKATTLLELSKKTSLESTQRILSEAAVQIEEESETIAKSFLDNSIDHDTFGYRYLERRKLAHIRRIKADRLRQETNESWTGNRPKLSL